MIFSLGWALGLAAFITSIVNSFYVLTKGTYWDVSYKLNIGVFRQIAKAAFFFAGLTNKYPGFALEIADNFSLDMAKPNNPNKLFAFPIFGGVARIILLIPFAIYTQVVQNGARIGTVASSIPVLINGNYPESTFELTRDALRLVLAQSAWITGLSDNYPSFKISMNHQRVKIILLVLGALITIFSAGSRRNHTANYSTTNQAPHFYTTPTRTD